MPETDEMEEFEFDYVPVTHVAGLIEVVRSTMVTPTVRAITFTGEALRGLEQHWRAEMLVRLYFPPPGTDEPPEPYIDEGSIAFRTTEVNEVSPFSAFSEDPLVRAFTGRRYRPDDLELDIEFVLHPIPGIAADWGRQAKPGDKIGIVEFALPEGHRDAASRQADVFVLLADDAGIPAALTNLEMMSEGQKVIAFFEVDGPDEERHIETAAELTVTWLHRNGVEPGTSGLLEKAFSEMTLPEGDVFVGVCGEIKMATVIRRDVKARGLDRSRYKTQAYWRRGMTEVERMARMTEVSLQAEEEGKTTFMETFESIGMSAEDPTLFESEET